MHLTEQSFSDLLNSLMLKPFDRSLVIDDHLLAKVKHSFLPEQIQKINDRLEFSWNQGKLRRYKYE